MPGMRHIILKTFTGPFTLIEHDDGSLATGWVDDELRERLKGSKLDRRLHPELQERLHRYFDGKAVDFSDVPLPSAADFQLRCWRACRGIPRGATITYAQLAARAGSPNAFRAAGQSMRCNRLPIIIPCHRVVASNGSLHGFAGSVNAKGRELSIKSRLLQMEGALADEVLLPGRSGSRKRTPALSRA